LTPPYFFYPLSRFVADITGAAIAFVTVAAVLAFSAALSTAFLLIFDFFHSNQPPRKPAAEFLTCFGQSDRKAELWILRKTRMVDWHKKSARARKCLVAGISCGWALTGATLTK